MVSFKDKIDNLLRKEKINNAQLAKALDISAPAFSNLKTKKLEDVPYHYLDKIIKLYNLDSDYFEVNNVIGEPEEKYNVLRNIDLWKVIDEQSATIKELSAVVKMMTERMK